MDGGIQNWVSYGGVVIVDALTDVRSLCARQGLTDVKRIIKLSIKSPSVSPLIPSAFTPYPLFQRYQHFKEILLNLSIKLSI